MGDIHPAVEAGNLQKQQERAAAKKQAKKKATKAFTTRAVIAIVLIVGLALAMGFDLIVPSLALPLEAGVMIWIAIWFGAWAQFMFAKGGLLDVQA